MGITWRKREFDTFWSKVSHSLVESSVTVPPITTFVVCPTLPSVLDTSASNTNPTLLLSKYITKYNHLIRETRATYNRATLENQKLNKLYEVVSIWTVNNDHNIIPTKQNKTKQKNKKQKKNTAGLDKENGLDNRRTWNSFENSFLRRVLVVRWWWRCFVVRAIELSSSRRVKISGPEFAAQPETESRRRSTGPQGSARGAPIEINGSPRFR